MLTGIKPCSCAWKYKGGSDYTALHLRRKIYIAKSSRVYYPVMFEIISHVMKLSNYMKILLENSEHNMKRSTIQQDQSAESQYWSSVSLRFLLKLLVIFSLFFSSLYQLFAQTITYISKKTERMVSKNNYSDRGLSKNWTTCQSVVIHNFSSLS